MRKLRLRNLHCTDCHKSVTESVYQVLELKLIILLYFLGRQFSHSALKKPKKSRSSHMQNKYWLKVFIKSSKDFIAVWRGHRRQMKRTIISL